MATINLTKAELLAGIKGIKPKTKEGTILEDFRRRFRRVRHSPQEKLQLQAMGFQHVLSSNVSAVKREGDNLVVRFHGGAVYTYPGQGKNYDNMLKSNSKGKWVWNNLIRKDIPFIKGEVLSLKSDEEFTDRDLMEVTEKMEKRTDLLQVLVENNIMQEKPDTSTNKSTIKNVVGLLSRNNLIKAGIIASTLGGE